jgi:hypothetical protein
MDFGFPILRGIFISPFSMRPLPEVQVTVDGKRQQVSVLSNSLIYGLVRQQSRGTIEKAIAADPRLSALVEQKATQMLARLAARFDRSSVPAYEEIFAAWGGEIRERSVDVTTGEVRPREITAPTDPAKNPPPGRLLGWHWRLASAAA